MADRVNRESLSDSSFLLASIDDDMARVADTVVTAREAVVNSSHSTLVF